MQNERAESRHFEDFVTLLDRYAEFIVRSGRSVRRSPRAEARALFSSMDPAKQARTVERLGHEIALFEEVVAGGGNLNDSRHLLWRYLARFRAVPCSDLFQEIRDTDVVEVYGLDQIHVFQNFNFFEFVSLTLEQVYSLNWQSASRREPRFERMIYDAAIRVISGAVTTTLLTEIPRHRIEEIDTEERLSFWLRLKCLSPVFTDKRLSYVIAVSECHFQNPDG